VAGEVWFTIAVLNFSDVVEEMLSVWSVQIFKR